MGDLSFVLRKYSDAFAELVKAENLTYSWSDWGDAELADFCMVLPHCCNIIEVVLGYNYITNLDPLRDALLSGAVGQERQVTVWLEENPIPDDNKEQFLKAL